MKRPSASSAFSLIEVLIATAIIAVLTAFIFAGSRALTDQARQTGCVNNLRQIHVAIQNYAMEHGQVIVPFKTVTELSWIGWYTKLSPYLGNRVAPLPIAPRCPAFKPDYNPTSGYTGYAMNANLLDRKIAAIPAPSKTPLLWDDKQLGSNNYGGWPDPAHGTGGTYCDMDFRHRAQCDVLLADGSVVSLNQPKTPVYSPKASPKDFPQYQWKIN